MTMMESPDTKSSSPPNLSNTSKNSLVKSGNTDETNSKSDSYSHPLVEGHGAAGASEQVISSNGEKDLDLKNKDSDNVNSAQTVLLALSTQNSALNISPTGSRSQSPVPPSTESKSQSASFNNTSTMELNVQKQKMADLLAHRKLLLSRLTSCRMVSEQRLDNIAKEESKTETSHDKSGKGGFKETCKNTATSTVPTTTPNSTKQAPGEERDEVTTFREICKFAMQFNTKKTLERSSSVPSRGSISLRQRGSSVGKKMQAAVATLKTNTGWISDSSSSNNAAGKAKNTKQQQGGPSPLSAMHQSSVDGSQIPITGGVGVGPVHPSPLPIATNLPNQPLKSSKKGALGPQGTTVGDKIHSAYQSSSTPQHQPLPNHPTSIQRGNSVPITTSSTSTSIPIQQHPAPTGKQLKSKKAASSQSGGPSKKLKRNSSQSRTTNQRNITNSNTAGGGIIGGPSSENLPIAKKALHVGLNNGEADYTHWAHSNPAMVQQGGGMLIPPPPHPTGSNSFPMEYYASYPSRILCPEAEKLRNQRCAIEGKLEALFHEQYRRKLEGKKSIFYPSFGQQQQQRDAAGALVPNTKTSNSKSGKKQATTSTSSISMNEPSNIYHGKSPSWKNVMEVGMTPHIFPHRNKTQWDNVLEEMRWLATDFIEERKWKNASARVVSSELLAENHLKSSSSSQSRLSALKSLDSSVRQSPDLDKKLDSLQDSTPTSSEKSEHENKIEKQDLIIKPKESEHISYEHINDSTVVTPVIKYHEISKDDREKAKSISRLMCLMIKEHWDATVSTDIIGKYTPVQNSDPYENMYSRFRKARNDYGVSTQTKDDASSTKECSNEENLEMNDEINRKGLSYNEITQTIDKRLRFAEELKEKIKDSSVSVCDALNEKIEKSNIRLHTDQLQVIEFIDQLWKCDASCGPIGGTVISGPPGCGKTISTGALLWKRRMNGPQLLLCPTASVFRWRHELQRFSGLNVLTWGKQGWCYSESSFKDKLSSSQKHKQCDVIVCDFSNLSPTGMAERSKNHVPNVNLNVINFATVVVDIRCVSVCANLVVDSNIDKPTLKNKGKRKRATFYSGHVDKGTRNIPDEILSSSWWQELILLLRDKASKSVLVESTAFIDDKERKDTLPRSFRDSSVWDEILSYQVALLHHQLFRSKKMAFSKKVMIWAKKFLSISSSRKGDENEKGLRSISSSEGARGLLTNVIKAMYLQRESSFFTANKNAKSSSIPHWNVCLCRLPTLQRRAYERTCSFVRGALSSNDWTTNIGTDIDSKHISQETTISNEKHNHAASAKALLKLRQTCFHSDLSELVTSSDEKSALGVITTQKKKRSYYQSKAQCSKHEDWKNLKNNRGLNSPSQPQTELANSFLRNSSKLKELKTILENECGYVKQPGGIHLKSSKKQKILILATLPEVLLLTSMFLNSVGISNDLLVSMSSELQNKDKVGTGDDQRVHSKDYSEYIRSQHLQSDDACSWAQCQQAIGRFNNEKNDSKNENCTSHVVLVSPSTIGSNSLGLCASNADFVISLDEDWSGRSNLQICSILTKCYSRRKNTKQKFIKLISEGTCEQVFLTVSAQSKCLPSAIPISMTSIASSLIDEDGHLVPTYPALFSPSNNPSYLLGSNVLRLKNSPLSTALGMRSALPPSLSTGETLKFLSGENTPDNIGSTCVNDLESTFYDNLLEAGNIPSLLDDVPNFAEAFYTCTSESLENGILFGIAMAKTESISTNFSTFHTSSCSPYNAVAADDAIINVVKYDECAFQPSPVPFKSLSNRDVASHSIQNYLERMKRKASFLNVSSDKSHHLSKQPKRVISSKAKSSTTWKKSTATTVPGTKTTCLASSLLNYSCNIEKKGTIDSGSNSNKRRNNEIERKRKYASSDMVDQKEGRLNKFALSYIFSDIIQDGHQGQEPLLYFPPLLPNLIQAAYKRSLNEENSSSSIFSALAPVSKKRKEIEPALNSKKLRKLNTSSIAPIGTTPTDDFLSLDSAALKPISQPSMTISEFEDPNNDLSFITGNEPDLMESATALFGDEFLPDIIPKKEEIPPKEVHKKDVEIEKEVEAHYVEDDFGILGIGILPPNSRNVYLTGAEQVQSNAYSNWLDPFEPHLPTLSTYSSFCDPEEASSLSRQNCSGVSLCAVILQVRGKPRKLYEEQLQRMGMPAHPPHPFPPQQTMLSRAQSLPINVGMALPNGISDHAGGRNPPLKKKKKLTTKSSIPVAPLPLPFSRSITGDGTQTASFGAAANLPVIASSIPRTKDSSFPPSRNMMGKGRKQGGVYMLLSSGAHCGSPSVRFRRHIIELLHRSDSRTIPVSHGSSHSSVHEAKATSPETEFSMLALPLAANTSTGDMARNIGNEQLQVFENSVYPCKVDFGPFSTGFLSNSSSDTGLRPSPQHNGINLPMGVKVPQRSKENHVKSTRSIEKWSSDEDQRLKAYATRFGLNFHIICHALTWAPPPEVHPTTGTCFDSEIVRNSERSARQCRERWNHISPPELSDGKNDKKFPLTAPVKLSTANDIGEMTILAHPSFAILADDNVKNNPMDVATRKNRLKKAREKRHHVPLAIPNYNSNSKSAPPIVEPHPSQSTGSSGRTELWPLQFLDLAEKQQQGSNSSASRQQEKTTNTKQPSSQKQSPRRQANSSQQHRQSASSTSPHSASRQQETNKQNARAAALAPTSSHGRTGPVPNNSQASPQQPLPMASPQQPQHQSVPPQGSAKYPQHMSNQQHMTQMPVQAPVQYQRQQQQPGSSSK